MWKNQESKKWVSLQDVYIANERYNPLTQSDKKDIFPLHFIISFTSRCFIDCLFMIYTFKIACKSFLPPFMLHCLIKFSSHQSTSGALFGLYRYHITNVLYQFSSAYVLKDRQRVSILSLCLAPQ